MTAKGFTTNELGQLNSFAIEPKVYVDETPRVGFTEYAEKLNGRLAMIGFGKSIPVNLTQDGKWQYQNVALLDFENKSGGCANGTVETRNQIVGTIPKGNYQGLQFTLGVPFNLNHLLRYQYKKYAALGD